MAVCFPDEARRLEIIKNKLNTALRLSQEAVAGFEAEYRDSKRYLVEFRHEIDPKELFTGELSLKQTERLGNFALHMRDKIAKLLDSPYFARIDFRCAEEKESKAYYIGRFSFDDGQNILIYDWRAPVSNMFYDYELGKAAYDAPAGRIEGELTRRRQFGIRRGRLEYAFESSLNIQDDVLQRELGHTSDEKMKSIIATIQREQNSIIRNSRSDTLIIQGVAGSGKTSIALHRIAFLLYRHREQLSASNVVIISPGKVFSDYISGVLPELGEEPVWEMSFADVATVQLDSAFGFETENDPVEKNDAAWAERVRFKSSYGFLNMMEKYLSETAISFFEPRDYTYGRFMATGQWIMERFAAYTDTPITKRLQAVADDILYRFETDNIRGDELPAKRAVLKALLAMFRFKSAMALYKDFYRSINAPHMLKLPRKNTLEWADVYPFLYFRSAFEGLKENRLVKHLVIDEMQDYTPAQYAVINTLFPCNKTILGDFYQSAHPCHTHSLDDLIKLYTHSEIVRLNKSYRCTYEIMTFAKNILNVPLEAVERHGEAPRIIRCPGRDELTEIKKVLDDFKGGAYTTLGIILKMQAQAESVYKALCGDYDMNLLTSDSEAFTNGITVASVRLAKGLEFDEVIVPSADSKTYRTDFDRRLLYIACTRAMHKLSLTCTGELTEFIKPAG